jgi:hypothetical protein
MHIKGLGLGGLVAIVALVGCGSSGGTGGTAGSTGHGGTTGGAGITGSGGTGTGTGGRAGTTGSGGSGGAFTTSLPSGTKITGLTSAQATQLCADLANYDDHTLILSLCNAAASSSVAGLTAAYFDLRGNPAATDAQLRADCTAANADSGSSSSDCISALADGGTQTCNISSTPSTCQATVGDFTKCINDQTAAALQYYASFPSCSSITAASLKAFFAADGGVDEGPPEPTSCSMFDSTCDVDGGTAAMTNMSPLQMPHLKR